MSLSLATSRACPERLISDRLRFDDGGAEVRLGPRAQAARAAVREKIVSGAYRFEEAACFCGASEGATLATKDRYGLWYPLVLCGRCGLLRANPRMDRASYVAFYRDDYRALYGDEDEDFDGLYARRLAEGRAVHAFIRKHVTGKLPVVLDVGCNLGAMLVPFAGEGCEVFGVDFGAEYLRRGRERTGLKNLLEGDISAFLALGRKADLIISSHSLEHFLDLEGEVGKLREALAPGGRLFVTVPGTDNHIEAVGKLDLLGLLQNAHTWQFDNQGLDYVMECCGFKPLASDGEIKAIYTPHEGRRDKGDVPPGAPARVDAYLRSAEKRYVRRSRGKKFLAALGVKDALKSLLRR